MFKRFLIGAAMTLAAGLGMAGSASAGIATFDSQAAFRCDANTTEHDGGLSFAQDVASPWYSCFYSPADPADFPAHLTSTVMAIGFTPITLTADDGNPFDLLSLELAAGPYTTRGDTTFVEGFLHGGGSVTTTLTLGHLFQRDILNWTGLDSVRFSTPQTDDGYIGFDNVRYAQPGNPAPGGVPEPAVWSILLLGFATSGLMLRRARQLAQARIS